MPRPRKTKTPCLPQVDYAEAREHLLAPLESPRPWIHDCQRDPSLRDALLRNIERRILTR